MTYLKTYPIHCTYQGGLSTSQSITFVISDELLELCKNNIDYIVDNEPGLTNIGKLVNDYLGVNVISSNMPFYHGSLSSDRYITDTVVIPNMAKHGITLKAFTMPDSQQLQQEYAAVTALTNNNQNLNDIRLGGRLVGSLQSATTYGNTIRQAYGPHADYTFYGANNYIIAGQLYILPSDVYNADGSFNKEKYNGADFGIISFVTGSISNSDDTFSAYTISCRTYGDINLYNVFPDNFKTTPYNSTDSDISNPYGEDGSSTTGGGDGTLGGGDLDSVDPTEVPDLPTVSAAASGFITLYNPTSSVLKDLYSFLWSSTFDINTFKKLYTDPMDCIISLGILPCLPTAGGARNIMFGNVDSGVHCSTLASQFAKVQCGSVNIEKYVGSFMDYSPYVKIHLFLPFIGFVNLGTDDLMGGSISVTYHVDVLSGDCIAFISHSIKGVLYTYNGNCRAEIPLTAQNNTGILKNYYQAVAGIIPSTVNGAAGGAAGALGGAASGTLKAASNIALNSKPTYQRSGSLAGSAGLMGVQKPFIVIERPNISVPNNVEHYAGQTSNITMYLGSCSGYTVCEYVHLEGIAATTEEIAEMETLLGAGVYL